MPSSAPFAALLALVALASGCADDPPASAYECERLPASSCDAAAACRDVHAARLDVDAQCAAASEPVGCVPEHRECNAFYTFARGDGGVTYRFTDTCVPRGLMPIGFDKQAASWPACAR